MLGVFEMNFKKALAFIAAVLTVGRSAEVPEGNDNKSTGNLRGTVANGLSDPNREKLNNNPDLPLGFGGPHIYTNPPTQKPYDEVIKEFKLRNEVSQSMKRLRILQEQCQINLGINFDGSSSQSGAIPFDQQISAGYKIAEGVKPIGLAAKIFSSSVDNLFGFTTGETFESKLAEINALAPLEGVTRLDRAFLAWEADVNTLTLPLSTPLVLLFEGDCVTDATGSHVRGDVALAAKNRIIARLGIDNVKFVVIRTAGDDTDSALIVQSKALARSLASGDSNYHEFETTPDLVNAIPGLVEGICAFAPPESTVAPSKLPTPLPAVAETLSPSSAPADPETEVPSRLPTAQPTQDKTPQPTQDKTAQPTQDKTPQPTQDNIPPTTSALPASALAAFAYFFLPRHKKEKQAERTSITSGAAAAEDFEESNPMARVPVNENDLNAAKSRLKKPDLTTERPIIPEDKRVKISADRGDRNREFNPGNWVSYGISMFSGLNALRTKNRKDHSSGTDTGAQQKRIKENAPKHIEIPPEEERKFYVSPIPLLSQLEAGYQFFFGVPGKNKPSKFAKHTEFDGKTYDKIARKIPNFIKKYGGNQFSSVGFWGLNRVADVNDFVVGGIQSGGRKAKDFIFRKGKAGTIPADGGVNGEIVISEPSKEGFPPSLNPIFQQLHKGLKTAKPSQMKSSPDVNVDYWYKDMDMTAMLLARIAGEADLVKCSDIGVLASVQTNELANRIKEHRQQYKHLDLLLVPVNIGENHWVGLLLEFDKSNRIVGVEYSDSIAGSKINEDVKQAVNKIVGNHLMNIRSSGFTKVKTVFTQTDGSSCGPCTVENLIEGAKSRRINGYKSPSLGLANAQGMRKKQLESLRAYDQRDPVQYNEFVRAQKTITPPPSPHTGGP